MRSDACAVPRLSLHRPAVHRRLGSGLPPSGIECDAVLGEAMNPYEVIVKAAEERHCDIILMASHGRKGLNKLFLGSETQKVLAHTHLPVLVLR